MAEAGQFDRVGDYFAADERGAHAVGTHRDPVAYRDGGEFDWRRASIADTAFGVLGQVTQVIGARHDFDPGVSDTDERLGEIFVGVSDRLHHRARWSARRPVEEGAAVRAQRFA